MKLGRVRSCRKGFAIDTARDQVHRVELCPGQGSSVNTRIPEHADQRSGLMSITIPPTELIHEHPAPLTHMRQRQVLHLGVALPEARELGHRGVEVGISDPDPLQGEGGLGGNLGDSRDAFRRNPNRRVKVRAKLIGARTRLGGPNAFHVRVIR
ncbi:MAG: hypothetical protein P4K98_00720 [Bryobacteraceae bacterium]|nr:hypothetical protein [Bryobacteraceae bacterium]